MSIPLSNIPRYTDIPLPPHRFLPGDATPAEIPPLPGPPTLVPPQQWRDCTAYLYGCDLYNHGFWWESHEIWEDLWHQAADHPQPRLQHAFLQGLIQVAACAIKLEQRKAGGLRSLLSTSEAHLHTVIAHVGGNLFMGIPVKHWLADVQRYYRTASHHTDDFPAIRLSG